MVTHRARMAAPRNAEYAATTRLGFSTAPVLGGRSSAFPISGANRTATSHDARRAMATTAKIENVYSPALLSAKPIGTKLAIVTSVPISIGAASVR